MTNKTTEEIKDEFSAYYDTWTSLSEEVQNEIVEAYKIMGNMQQAYNSVVEEEN